MVVERRILNFVVLPVADVEDGRLVLGPGWSARRAGYHFSHSF